MLVLVCVYVCESAHYKCMCASDKAYKESSFIFILCKQTLKPFSLTTDYLVAISKSRKERCISCWQTHFVCILGINILGYDIY